MQTALAILAVQRSRFQHGILWFLCLLGLLSTTGCAFYQQLIGRNIQPLPRALPPAATLDQIIAVVNSNSSLVTSFSTNHATVSTPGFPALRANLAYQRQRSFRLRAEMALSGPEVDLGSNDELFWFWVRRETPPALYYCRHDQYANSAASKMLPVEPDWFGQALGLVSFEPNEQHDGPHIRRDGKLEIRSTSASLNGLRRVTIVDEASGIVLEQHMYDPRGSRIASAILSEHLKDPVTGAILPRRVKIEWPPSSFEMTIYLTDLQVNRLTADPAALFSKPDYPGYVNIDLAASQMLGPPAANVAPITPLPAPPN